MNDPSNKTKFNFHSLKVNFKQNLKQQKNKNFKETIRTRMFALHIYILWIWSTHFSLNERILQSYQISVEQQLLSSSEFNNGDEFNTS